MFTNGYMFLLSFYTLKIAAAVHRRKNVQPHQSGVKSDMSYFKFYVIQVSIIEKNYHLNCDFERNGIND